MATKRINGSIVEFAFKRSECLGNDYLESSGSNSFGIGSLYRINDGNPESVCLLSNGASSASPLSSTRVVGSINKYLKQSSSITFEFWIQPNITYNEQFVWLSVSNVNAAPSSTSCTYNLRVSITTLLTFDEGGYRCTLLLRLFKRDTLLIQQVSFMKML